MRLMTNHFLFETNSDLLIDKKCFYFLIIFIYIKHDLTAIAKYYLKKG